MAGMQSGKKMTDSTQQWPLNLAKNMNNGGIETSCRDHRADREKEKKRPFSVIFLIRLARGGQVLGDT